jgi:hypothetical protein
MVVDHDIGRGKSLFAGSLGCDDSLDLGSGQAVALQNAFDLGLLGAVTTRMRWSFDRQCPRLDPAGGMSNTTQVPPRSMWLAARQCLSGLPDERMHDGFKSTLCVSDRSNARARMRSRSSAP